MLGGYSQDIHWGQEESNHQRYRQSHPVESMMRDYWLIHRIVRMNHHNLGLRLMSYHRRQNRHRGCRRFVVQSKSSRQQNLRLYNLELGVYLDENHIMLDGCSLDIH